MCRNRNGSLPPIGKGLAASSYPVGRFDVTPDEIRALRQEARDLKEMVAKQTLELHLIKKSCSGLGRPRVRYPASEKLEIIRLVEEGYASVRQTLAKRGIPRTTFYSLYDRYLQRGEAGLQDQPQDARNATLVSSQVARRIIKPTK